MGKYVYNEKYKTHIWVNEKHPVGTAKSAKKLWNTRVRLRDSFCEWKEEGGYDFSGTYQTTCGEMFTITEGSPSDNNFKFCVYCGKKIIHEQR